MIDLQIAAYWATPAALAAPLGVELGELEAGAPPAGALDAAVEVFAGALVAVEPLVLELALLPQPALSAPQSSAATSGAIRLAVMDPPRIEKLVRSVQPTGERLVGQG